MSSKSLIPAERIDRVIYLIRDQKVMLDQDLANLYGVETKRLIEAIKRNRGRFPADFMFQLTREEFENLRSQFATSSWGGRRYPPYAFTEQGVAMLSSVLRSEEAIRVNVEIMRAFVRLRGVLASHQELAGRIEELAENTDQRFRAVYDVIRELVEPPMRGDRKAIGYHTEYQDA